MPLVITRGLAPDRASTRSSDKRFSSLYKASATPTAWFMQNQGDIRDQLGFPSCVGQALAACIDAAHPGAKASGVSIWREARRRQGLIEQIAQGTRIEYAVEGLVHRGWDRWTEGEDNDLAEAGAFAPPAGDDLADELFAHDKRVISQRSRITETGAERGALIETALKAGHGVVLGIGTNAKFVHFKSSKEQGDVVLSTSYLGGDVDGHAMRVKAFSRDSGGHRIFMLQNSWGLFWGGCHGPDRSWQPGCAWVSQEAINAAWDVHVVELRKYK